MNTSFTWVTPKIDISQSKGLIPSTMEQSRHDLDLTFLPSAELSQEDFMLAKIFICAGLKFNFYMDCWASSSKVTTLSFEK